VRKWEAPDNVFGANYRFVVKIDHRSHLITNDSVTRV
jgi:hypothetical protein